MTAAEILALLGAPSHLVADWGQGPGAGLRAYSAELDVSRHLHVVAELTPDHRVQLAVGPERWTGRPAFGEARVLPAVALEGR